MLARFAAIAVALLAGVALVWVIAADSGGGSDNSEASRPPLSPLERKAVRVERRLEKSPTDEGLLLATMYAWVGAGNARLEDREFGDKSPPPGMAPNYRTGLRAWGRYLEETGGKAAVDDAEYAGAAYFSLVEIGSKDPEQVSADAAGAARALRIACRQRGNLFNLSNLATYEYFDGDVAAGNRAAQRAAADAKASGAAIAPAAVIDQLNGYRERGEKFVARVKEGFETLEETGEDELDEPIKGYGSSAGINGGEPDDL